MPAMVRQPQEIQTLYAELSERLAAYEAARSFSSLKGSFARKHVSGADYWYFKTSETPSGQREYSVGPDTPATRSVIEAHQKGRAEVEEVDLAASMGFGLRLPDLPDGLTGLSAAPVHEQRDRGSCVQHDPQRLVLP